MKKTKMTFVKSVSTCIKKYFKIRDRAGRREFWYFALLIVIFMFAQMLFIFDNIIYNTTMSYVVANVIGFCSLFFIIPEITVSIRRLHDINKSGLWMLLVFLPIIGSIILIVFFCKKPYPKTNKYGDCNNLG